MTDKKETKKESENKTPIQYLMGNIKISEFINEVNEVKYSSYVIDKFYKEEDSDDWKTTKSFNDKDMIKLKLLLDGFINLKNEIKVK